MPRQLRRVEAGTIYHVINRGNLKRPLFLKDGDFLAFLDILAQGLERYPVDLLAYCLMGNHWHLVLRPRKKDALSALMRWVTTTHSRRMHAHRAKGDVGHVYQGRFKSFPVQSDEHFLAVVRYVEANPRRAKLVTRAEEWPWSSFPGGAKHGLTIASWPVDRPRRWGSIVNDDWDEKELADLQASLGRGRPFGTPAWCRAVATRLGLESSLRPVGRPRKPPEKLSPRQLRRRKKTDHDTLHA